MISQVHLPRQQAADPPVNTPKASKSNKNTSKHFLQHQNPKSEGEKGKRELHNTERNPRASCMSGYLPGHFLPIDPQHHRRPPRDLGRNFQRASCRFFCYCFNSGSNSVALVFSGLCFKASLSIYLCSSQYKSYYC